MPNRPRIVIAGAGFGGIYTLRYLNKILRPEEAKITIINRNDYFLFTPLLHEVATYEITAAEPIEKLKSIIKNADIIIDEIIAIDGKTNKIITKNKQISFDFLVIALGSVTNIYNLEGADKYCLYLKTLTDAIKLRAHLLAILKKASNEKDHHAKRAALTFVVVGGGPTGVEIAGELRGLFRDMINKNFKGKIDEDDIKCVIAQKEAELLHTHPKKFQGWARDELKKKKWLIMTGKTAKKIYPDAIEFSDGEIIPTQTVIWTAGVIANSFTCAPLPMAKNMRLNVDKYLRTTENKNIFAIGDNANAVDSPNGWPMLAQAATQNAKIAAQNIARAIRRQSLKEFKYSSKGSLVSIGRWQAMAEINGFQIKGRATWLLWNIVYLFKFISWRKKIRITLHWLTHAFRARKI